MTTKGIIRMNQNITHFGGNIPSVICIAYATCGNSKSAMITDMHNNIFFISISLVTKKSPYLFIVKRYGLSDKSAHKLSCCLLPIHLHLLYHRRSREAVTGRSSDYRIVLLIAPSHTPAANSGLAIFVIDYSGGSVPCSSKDSLLNSILKIQDGMTCNQILKLFKIRTTSG